MSPAFFFSLQSEWLKQRKSLASWMVLLGAFFTPAIVVVVRLLHHEALPALYAKEDFWSALWKSSWESAAIFYLPIGGILATTLIAQIEYKNNAWKLVHALPLSLATLYFSKLAIVLLMLGQFFVLFNVGIYLSAVLPPLLVSGVPFPKGPVPHARFLWDNGWFFLDCLPIVALQYAISLRFRNFLTPVGIGFMLWVGTLAALSWRWNFVIPYSYTMIEYLSAWSSAKVATPAVDIHVMALGYSLLFTLVGYGLFATREEKG
ncbi:ABC transporter permease [Myxococcus sp. K38C18041901]|uniref:ABC transporter permease n=1 Tax=Myxococcus guangdongensis TaxID=2906760 RepID=UPI0020A7DBD2|nr:ABC transporter permease [Myxococcus guangdongensis]MCP3064192.1 ABC transporter permease [Myxococcus guangdongensis]